MHGLLERHWDVDDPFVLPALDDVVVDGEVEHDTVDVTKTYYDTAERDLKAQGVVLYRRDVQDADGETAWRLEIPVDRGRSELHWVGSDVPPAEAVSLLTGLTAGKPVVDVAKIHTMRASATGSAARRSVGRAWKSTTIMFVRRSANACWRGAKYAK
jgi:hypothetical protein